MTEISQNELNVIESCPYCPMGEVARFDDHFHCCTCGENWKEKPKDYIWKPDATKCAGEIVEDL